MTPESLVRHELAGLAVAIEDSPNPDLVGLSGEVVDETTNTLLVAMGDGVRQVPKADATFRFTVDRTDVLVDGERLVARPARRTETNGGKLWQ